MSRNIEVFRVQLNLCAYNINLALTFVVFIISNFAFVKLPTDSHSFSSSSKCAHKILVLHGSQRILS